MFVSNNQLIENYSIQIINVESREVINWSSNKNPS